MKILSRLPQGFCQTGRVFWIERPSSHWSGGMNMTSWLLFQFFLLLAKCFHQMLKILNCRTELNIPAQTFYRGFGRLTNTGNFRLHRQVLPEPVRQNLMKVLDGRRTCKYNPIQFCLDKLFKQKWSVFSGRNGSVNRTWNYFCSLFFQSKTQCFSRGFCLY